MKNNKGQALIEFAIILPIFLLILLYIIEFTKVFYQKYELETHMNFIINLYESNKSEQITEYVNKNNLIINYSTNNNLTKIRIIQNTKYNLPLLNSIFGPNLTTSRTVYNEE